MSANLQFYLSTIAIYACLNGILVLGLNMQFGLTGILNLAYIVLVAVGAYTTGIASLSPAASTGLAHYIGGFNWPFPWNLLFGVAVTVVFSLVLGSICFSRISHWYLALTLSSIGYALLIMVGNDSQLFNGYVGLTGIQGPWEDQLSPGIYQLAFLGLAAVLLAVVWLIFWQVERAPLGRALRALREDELAARSLAKSPIRLRMIGFLLGGAAAGLGGGLSALYFGGWNSGSWQPGETFILLAAVMVGGRGRSTGAILGSLIVLEGFIEGTRFLPTLAGRPDLLPALQAIAVSLLLLAVLWFRPLGLWPEPKERFPRFATPEPESSRAPAVAATALPSTES